MTKVAFCFIVKDGEKYLAKNIQKIINLANECSFEYRIYYVENDSVDNTINILKKYKKQYNNIYGKHLKLDGLHSTNLCKNNINVNCSKRTRRLAYLRNLVLEQAKLWSDCDYLIMLDLDFIDFNKKEFKNMFTIINNNSNINGIFGMSVNKNKHYYDTGAIRPENKIFNLMISNKKLIKVKSAFSGFGIYKMKSIRNIKYNIKTNEIEHIDFNKKLKNLYIYTPFNPIYEGPSYVFELIINFIFIMFVIILFFM